MVFKGFCTKIVKFDISVLFDYNWFRGLYIMDNNNDNNITDNNPEIVEYGLNAKPCQ